MSETQEAKLGPFHETVQMALFQAAVGCQTDPYKQGELAGLLDLIYKTEVPPEGLAQLIKTCEAVRDTLHGEILQTPPRVLPEQKKYLEGIAGIAEATVESLQLRLEQLEQKGAEGQEVATVSSGNTE